MKETQVRNQVLSDKLHEERRKCKNRYKQLRRRDANVQQQKKTIQTLSNKFTAEKKRCGSQEKQYVKAVAVKERYRAKTIYAQRKMEKATSEAAGLHDKIYELQEELDSNVHDLLDTISAKEKDYDTLHLEYEERIAAPIQASPLPTITGGKFSDSIRQCCIELLSLNVGVRNVEPVIRSVLRNVAGVDVDRLPKYSTLVGMFSEMKVLAYQQLAEELTEYEHTTLHSDGTTKFGHHYGSFQISTEKSAYTLGLMEMVSGSSKNSLDCLKEILSGIDKVSSGDAGKKILAKIKNTMSDRHVVEKCFNTLLEEYRVEVLPCIIENWDELSDTERAKMSNMNSFFCGMHLVVGMADTAASTLKEWEEIHFEAPQGAAVFAKNEAGTCVYNLYVNLSTLYIPSLLHTVTVANHVS